MQRAVDGGGGGSGGRAAQMIGEYKEKVEGELKDICAEVLVRTYRARNKGMHILLSNSQAGPGRTVKQKTLVSQMT